MLVSDRPYQERLLQLAARQFVSGALEGFDPRLGEPVEVSAPSAADQFEREAMAISSADEISRDRVLAAYARCVELAELSRRLRLARAA